MVQQFVSFERLAQYDALIKQFIESKLSTIADADGLIDTKINDAFKEFVTQELDPEKLDTYKDLIEYANQHGVEYAQLIKQLGEKATEDKAATGIYKEIEDSANDVKNLELDATSDTNGDIIVTLSGTVANPALDVFYNFCSEEDINKLFIPVLQAATYDALVDAIANAVPGQTIKIQSPITQQVTIPADKEVVLDLNGQTISSTGSAIVNNGILTISDNSLGRSNGGIVSTKNCGIAAGNNSVTTILSGTISGQEGAVITGKSSGAVINIEGGNLSAADNAVIAGNGTNREGEPNVINISGGTFVSNIESKGYIACGVYAPWKDVINITGGEFVANNGCGVLARAGQVNITGGTFTASGTETGWVGDNKNQVPCAAVVFDSIANYPGMDDDSKITISGGTFNSDVNPIQTLGDSSRIVDLR